METVRWQCEHTRKCSGAHRDHQEQAQPKSAYGRREDKRADTERGTDLPDELLAGSRATHACNREAILKSIDSLLSDRRSLRSQNVHAK